MIRIHSLALCKSINASITMSAASSSVPNLAPPGAGLPFPESLLVRLFGRLAMRRRYTWDSAIDDIEATAERIIARFDALPPEIQSTPVLVDRLRGLEDSSRFWSPSMALEHLNITGGSMLMMVLMLSHGKTTSKKVDTAAVKPVGKPPAEVLEAFMKLHRGARERLRNGAGELREGPSHVHPWFGALHATDWLRLMASHLRLHERQLAAVLARDQSSKRSA